MACKMSAQPDENFECPVCFCSSEELAQVKPCSHWFCSNCIINWQKFNKNCPICRTVIDSAEEHGRSNKRKRVIVQPRRADAVLAEIRDPQRHRFLETAGFARILECYASLHFDLNPKRLRTGDKFGAGRPLLGANVGSKENPINIE